MKIGIFGGSFDPIHLGHLILAEQCREELDLDLVWFVPCAIQPHKQDGPTASDRQRSEMITLATSGHAGFQLSKVELERGETSYTVDTLEHLQEAYPDDELFLLIGDDSLESFPRWREPQKICEMANLVVVARPGSGNVDLDILEPFVEKEKLEYLKSIQFESARIEISSTDIRLRVAGGKSIRYLTPRSVEKYIETQKLYLPS